MLTINIVCVGKIKEQYLKDAITEYSKRLSRYCKLHIIEVPDEKIPDKLNNTISEEIQTQIFDALALLEERLGKKFGDTENPLLVSV